MKANFLETIFGILGGIVKGMDIMIRPYRPLDLLS